MMLHSLLYPYGRPCIDIKRRLVIGDEKPGEDIQVFLYRFNVNVFIIYILDVFPERSV